MQPFLDGLGKRLLLKLLNELEPEDFVHRFHIMFKLSELNFLIDVDPHDEVANKVVHDQGLEQGVAVVAQA